MQENLWCFGTHVYRLVIVKVVNKLNAFLAALSFLTRIPVPVKGGNINSQSLSRSIIYFPLVGAIVGSVSAGSFILLQPFLPRAVLSVVIIALPIFLTGGIHFDGLLDTCDGLFSGRSRERSLEIMRDSRVGSMGVIAGILNILLRYNILIVLPGTILPVLLIAQPLAGRWVMSMALYFFPYARREGGLGSGFNEDKKAIYVALSSITALAVVLIINGIAGVSILLITGAISVLAAIWAAGKIGGLTGDVYGALNEAAENIFLLLWLVAIIVFQVQP